MILVAIGSNLAGPLGPPRDACEAAIAALAAAGIAVQRRSRWFESAPVPRSDQPWFINGVIAIDTTLDEVALLRLLHSVEAGFGRVRSAPNAARILDLDLIDFNGRIRAPGLVAPILPHPRATDRPFVLLPMTEVAPSWRHPATGIALQDFVRQLSMDGEIRPL